MIYSSCGLRPLMIDDGNRMIRFCPESYYLVRADGNYCDVYIERSKKKPVYVLSYRIGMLCDVLSKWGFVRINRSELVNTQHVSEIIGNCLILDDGTELKMSRTYRDEVVAQFDVLRETQK